MVSSLLIKADLKSSFSLFFAHYGRYDMMSKKLYALLKKQYNIKICRWVMSSEMNSLHHGYIFLCLECKEIFRRCPLHFSLNLLSKMMFEVKRFHEGFLVVRNNPNYKVPPPRNCKTTYERKLCLSRSSTY